MKQHPFGGMGDIAFRRHDQPSPIIAKEAAHYIIRPDADNPGAFVAINRKANPAHLRAVADMIEKASAP